MAQLQNVPGPSQDDFDSLSEQIAKCIQHGTVNTGTMTSVTQAGQTMYYKDITFSHPMDTVPHIAFCFRNTQTSMCGYLVNQPYVSNVNETGFNLISPVQLSGYYIDWVAVST